MTNEDVLSIAEHLLKEPRKSVLYANEDEALTRALAVFKAAVEAEEAVDNLNAGTPLLPHHMQSLEALQDALNEGVQTDG